MKLAALGMIHEANSFVRTLVDEQRFKGAGVLRGAEIVDRHTDATSPRAGYLPDHES